jgi:glycosyltransferase involved in cell wall biosynthesis
VKIAICHQGFAATDAIGNDMAGMYWLLERMHFEPVIVCAWSSREACFRTSAPEKTDWNSFDLIIYHHSQYWHVGDSLVRDTSKPIMFKYHNITPAHYLEPYFAPYAESCARGREQTDLLLAARPENWVSDSSFSRDELIEAGASEEHVCVVPPFNRVSELLPLAHQARYDTGAFNVLFVGRITPHKGHFHLLRVASLLVDHFGRDVCLRIVGGSDAALKTYNAEITAQVRPLGLATTRLSRFIRIRTCSYALVSTRVLTSRLSNLRLLACPCSGHRLELPPKRQEQTSFFPQFRSHSRTITFMPPWPMRSSVTPACESS